jgi:hypothetical protein
LTIRLSVKHCAKEFILLAAEKCPCWTVINIDGIDHETLYGSFEVLVSAKSPAEETSDNSFQAPSLVSCDPSEWFSTRLSTHPD